ncbi:MAG: DMT family transporter [Armatimonadetes bacterium]|nr:DMT family transporter [Armatimonadota bacterium]MCA1996931.1 DMT family transporter [Armatimonadota bacterium]
MSRGLRLMLILLGLNLLWAPTLLIAKVAQETFTPVGLVAVRWALFAAIMAALALARPRWLPMSLPRGADRAKSFAIGLCIVSTAHTLYYVGLGLSSSIETNVLNTLLPVFTAVLAFFLLREHVSARRWGAIALGVAGAYVVVLGFGLPKLSQGHTLGNLLYLAGVFFECLGMVLAARIILRSSGLGVLVFESAGVMVGTAAFALALRDPIVRAGSSPGWSELASLLYLAAVAGVFAFGVWYVLVEGAPVSLMMLSCLLQPPVAAWLGWLILRERLLPHTGFGALLIALGLVIAATERSRSSVRAVDRTDGSEGIAVPSETA